MSTWSMITFQDAVSPIMLMLTKFHDKTMVIIMFIAAYVTFLLVFIFNNNRLMISSPAQELELAWTIYPAVTLGGIALPSLRILYLMDDVTYPSLTLKVMGHQWYWSYNIGVKEFDSYMLNIDDLSMGSPRLLEVDNRVVIPSRIDIRLLVSSADVLHSWAIPSLGIKVDAVPGRLNQYSLMSAMPGVYYGQCSEICGANHSFMPIALESVNTTDWLKWAE